MIHHFLRPLAGEGVLTNGNRAYRARYIEYGCILHPSRRLDRVKLRRACDVLVRTKHGMSDAPILRAEPCEGKLTCQVAKPPRYDSMCGSWRADFET